ncbi:hypothetical protein [Halodurantibacterium flavum]|uniref:Uncharacterized protein n=1 Tax=Halodurantibacterium flavum TaxID=1382802 RepID=A0ABW4S9C6_9RHOB
MGEATEIRAASAPVARDPVGPRVLQSLRAGWRRTVHVMRWLDDHWIGDLIGVIALFGCLYLFLLLTWVIS